MKPAASMEAATSVEAAAEARSPACGKSHRIAPVVETAERAGVHTRSATAKGRAAVGMTEMIGARGVSERRAFAAEAVTIDEFPAVGVVRVIAVG
jgi:hypothetical protein